MKKLPENNQNQLTSGITLLLLLSLFSIPVSAQIGSDQLSDKFNPQKWVRSISDKADKLEYDLYKKSAKLLQRMQKQETRLRSKIAKKDSSATKEMFSGVDEKYRQLNSKLTSSAPASSSRQYFPALDTLQGSLKFLEKYKNQFGNNKELQSAIAQLNKLDDQFSKAEDIKKFIKERKQVLKAKLQQLGLAKELKKLNKEVYYYSAQINEYKEILKGEDKLQRKALEVITKIPAFQKFFEQHSQLAGIFRPSGRPITPQNISGLQTRFQVNQAVLRQLGTNRPDVSQQFSQNMQQAKTQIQQLKDKILKNGNGSSDEEMPDFKPNNEKIKSLKDRLVYGFNIQSQKSNSFVPATSDLALSLGYKLNDKSEAGLGASYRWGWGKSLRNITLTNEGVGLRSYLDWRLKGNIYVSGGFEMNYFSSFNSIDQLRDQSAWQKSGLLGVSRKYNISKKIKGKIQLLWDFLSYQQVPRAKPLLFRVSYNLN